MASARIKKGDSVVVLSGKDKGRTGTVAKVMPKDGKVVVDGQSLYDPSVDPVAVRRMIGMVFQRPNPFPTMSIYDNVLAGNRLNSKKMKKAEADDIVERSLKGANLWNEVKDRLGKPGMGLSGGQQQRL